MRKGLLEGPGVYPQCFQLILQSSAPLKPPCKEVEIRGIFGVFFKPTARGKGRIWGRASGCGTSSIPSPDAAGEQQTQDVPWALPALRAQG